MKKTLLIFLFITTLVADNSDNKEIKNIIIKQYKKTFPAMEIEKITLKNFSNRKITHINSIDTRFLNTKKTDGTIIVNKHTYLRYKIYAYIYVVKSTKVLKRNENITMNNVRVAKIKFFSLVTLPIKPSDIGNISVRNYTPKGKIIYEYNTRKGVLVTRGDVVQVVSKNSNIDVSFQAKALNDGGKGETINIDINGMKQRGKVIGKDLLEME